MAVTNKLLKRETVVLIRFLESRLTSCPRQTPYLRSKQHLRSLSRHKTALEILNPRFAARGSRHMVNLDWLFVFLRLGIRSCELNVHFLLYLLRSTLVVFSRLRGIASGVTTESLRLRVFLLFSVTDFWITGGSSLGVA